jgi:hypothetical protein
MRKRVSALQRWPTERTAIAAPTQPVCFRNIGRLLQLGVPQYKNDQHPLNMIFSAVAPISFVRQANPKSRTPAAMGVTELQLRDNSHGRYAMKPSEHARQVFNYPPAFATYHNGIEGREIAKAKLASVFLGNHKNKIRTI